MTNVEHAEGKWNRGNQVKNVWTKTWNSWLRKWEKEVEQSEDQVLVEVAHEVDDKKENN